ncbi:hypothetical protein CsSME_00036950 [Camellia sinensis var. sinensis]
MVVASKSRLDWAMKGDKNTRYFHTRASSRQCRNFMNSLLVNGLLLEEPSMVRAEVFRYFNQVFSEDWRSRPQLRGHFRSIGQGHLVDGLEAVFSEEEAWVAIHSCDGNKTVGPDGFNLACFQKCWKVFKLEVMQFFKEFHDYGKLVSGVNNSFITLIPKVDCPISISDYRPISLIGSIYKILAKVLANRLKKVVPKVIGEVQLAFLGGRNILDGVLIANEIVDWWKVNKKKGVILKFNFHKAYDSVSWDCLLSMMKEFGFGDRWRG